MLKWLVNDGGVSSGDIHDKITEDPLATIKLGKKKKNETGSTFNLVMCYALLIMLWIDIFEKNVVDLCKTSQLLIKTK